MVKKIKIELPPSKRPRDTHAVATKLRKAGPHKKKRDKKSTTELETGGDNEP